ncbi:RagB/SusD family nutrient uptake outer membrane protein [Confluentibacter flavum]|uniref:RagB/SusD family nutrient uptake outer membrane protein n=1 Tax=Confluentibacter flavum TaxID=1909700 RepID=A0A2N3HKT5_9FLAO|nr:RagB/SusD family nutrient uptake outer membrane protein [Confluentibacter flavum]PKQ45589.1 RagB/SusD family nutrient uptake outer membrane protein [Confluentibacter flavum]
MKKLILLITVICACYSCSDDILDLTPIDQISEASVWNDAKLTQAYHTNLYNVIQHGYKIHMQMKATDESFNSISWDIGNYSRGNINPDNITSVANTHWTGGGNVYFWNTGFSYLRKINLFLDKMEETSLEFGNKAQLIAEAKFLRAYTYFQFIERFGGVPIITETYNLGDEYSFERNTFAECVAFIEADLTAAIADLPARYASSDGNFGRATGDAAKALKSRMLLYAASPLFSPTKDLAKWQKAADAAEALLTSGYTLHGDYEELFNQPSGSANNEIIFSKQFSATNFHQAPMHNLGRRYGAYGGWWSSNGPSQNLVDDYDMTNGEPPFIYSGSGKTYTKTINPASGYDPQNPYANRDPRLDASVIHDESEYHGDTFEMWVSPNGSTYGFDSYKQSSDNPRSNYIIRKFMPDDNTDISWQTNYTNPWIIFRLGEIYLNYAEAKFELGDEATARLYLSKVRERTSVDMPAIPDNVTGEDLRKRIYNERRVELAFEEHRLWDVKRWKIAEDIENRPIYGMDIIKDGNVKTYTPVLLLDRTFLPEMYLLPIERSEILRNDGTITQTPGWDN